MNDSTLRAELLPTPLISSFVGRARAGDLYDSNASRRAAAWSHWAISNLTKMVSSSEREYIALLLPGRFYDPSGKLEGMHPHLELSTAVLERADSEFPDRLAQLGNGALFNWWMLTEVTALRRALLTRRKGSVGGLVDALNERRPSLVSALEEASKAAASSWTIIEDKLFTEEDNLSGDATGDFYTGEIASFFPPAKEMKLKIYYDTQLRETNHKWASRRVGVWQIVGELDGASFSLGVVTPRLTSNSLFKDPLFDAHKESPAALLVRSLLLRRLMRKHVGVKVTGAVTPEVSAKGGPHFRAIVANMGAKTPEASVASAVNFLRVYPDPENAWKALTRWASPTYLLTISQESFTVAHKKAARYIRRSEDPRREDINLLLPLAWDQGDNPRVVRATFSKGN